MFLFTGGKIFSISDDSNIAVRWLSQALNLKDGDTPFPWQLTLLDDFLKGRLWPALDIPTGLGKTSVMAIWLVARALGAALPRRMVYVVDRRAVVDQATEIALRLREFVEQIPEVKERLGLSRRSLPISTLRGQYVDNREWLDDPAAPAIIVGTIDMVGSRLLFQGYGVSAKMRPYHAALLGADTLTILDESHLVPAFEELLNDIANGGDLFGTQAKTLQALVPPFKLMSLSATGRRILCRRAFGLGAEDLNHYEIKRRLLAPKRLIVHDLQRGDKLAEALAAEAHRWACNQKRPIRCIVFCDKREDATRAKEEMERQARSDKGKNMEAPESESELFVGGRRVFERNDAAKRLESLGFLAGKAIERSRSAFLFATSAAEVGVDLDADCIVCDLVNWERMVQRLGRVNRRGDVPGGADVIVVVEPEPEPNRRIREALSKAPEDRDNNENKAVKEYEGAIAKQRAARKILVDLVTWSDGTGDLSLSALRQLNERAEALPEVRRILDAATTPEPLRPALTRAVVDSWSMTSLESHSGRPDIEPWLRGWIEDDPPQTEIVWRRYLPVRTRVEDRIETPKQETEAFFEAAPPHTSETLETETFRTVEWLAMRAKALLSNSNTKENMATSLSGQDVAAIVLTKSGKLKRTLRLVEFAPEKEKRKELHSLLANATLIIDARVAGLRDGLLEQRESTPPQTADDGQPWPVIGFRVRIAGSSESGVRHPQWRERFRLAIDVSDEGEPTQWLIVEKQRGDSANEEDRSAGTPQLLQEHRTWAEDCARTLAKKLLLPQEYEDMLCTAAFLHDEGKRAKRWQRAFNAPVGNEVYAKTKGPINYALLDHYRHEFGSIVAMEKHDRLLSLPDNLRDLAVHLIAAHHGFARPFMQTRGCDDEPPSVLEGRAKAIALSFAMLQQQWGTWGLAWWETLLRAADQQASRNNDARDQQSVSATHPGAA